MTVRIDDRSAVVKKQALEKGGGELLAGTRAVSVCDDGTLVSLAFGSEEERNTWLVKLKTFGVGAADVVAIGEKTPSWLAVDESTGEAWSKVAGRDAVADCHPVEHAPVQRLEHLSQSDSGLHYVRERKSGLLRALTDDELQGFNDPPPCSECGEQFGCEHLNCAREPLLSDDDVEKEVPQQWRSFARDYGVSRNDLQRLDSITQFEGEYRVKPDAPSDMRMQELVLLLNEAR